MNERKDKVNPEMQLVEATSNLGSGISNLIRAKYALTGKPEGFIGNTHEAAKLLLGADPANPPVKLPLANLVALQQTVGWLDQLVQTAIVKASSQETKE